jgi:Dna[CI] antecedent, DciA
MMAWDKTKTTNKQIKDLLPKALEQIGERLAVRPDLIVQAWPELIGEKLAPMTKAVAFDKGILTVKVSNSTLYSLLAQQERARLLRCLKQKFPAADIKNIYFRMG